MKRKIIQTADGSSTIFIEDWDEHYHSKHGAIQEAYHVFIRMGLDHYLEAYGAADEIAIMEIGFGTGLNAFITLLESINKNLRIRYEGIEGYPVKPEEVALLNYAKEIASGEYSSYFNGLHKVPWEEYHDMGKDFKLKKRNLFFDEITDESAFNLIYFDAFGARVQPELWTETIFQKMYKALKPGGVLVTYAAKGSVRRAMLASGFTVEKLPGPPGKREMLRATKHSGSSRC